MAHIHPTAVVDAKADLAESVSVGPYTVIGPDVQICDGTSIGPHCVIQGRTRIGRDNRIFQFGSIGADPQDKKYAGEATELVIGDRNTIREFCTLNRGTVQADGVTRIGDDNWIMAYVHIAHDCVIGNKTIFANNAQLAGHVEVGDWVIFGGFTAAHQFVKFGAHCMTSMGSIVVQDVPPFVMASGNTAQPTGLNTEGLKRRGFVPERINVVKQMYRSLYRRGLTLDQAKDEIAAMRGATPEAAEDVDLMLHFLSASSRGIVR